jgi:hypothetical protein
MWHEDEYSTVSSVLIQPKPKMLQNSIKPNTSRPPHRHLLPIFHRSKQQQQQQQQQHQHDKHNHHKDETDPIKIHVKRKRVKKSVVLLPQEDTPNKEELLGLDALTSAKQDAINNMVKARELLNAALVFEATPSLKESERMARFAFEHAQLARRLAISHSKSTGEEQPRINPELDLETNQEELERVLSYLAEQGQEAVYQHQKIGFSQSEEGDDEIVYDDQDDGVESQDEKSKHTKKRGLGEYASRAVHYLESILPKNIGEHNKTTGLNLIKALSAEDYWSDAGISTLGMNNDTFEYGFSCGVPSMPPVPQATTSRFNMDLMSLSSLNEILDGPMDDDQPAKADDDNTKISPRKAIPVIDVPNRKPSKKAHKTPKSISILGLVTPTVKKHSLKNLLTPRKNTSTDSSMQATTKATNSNMQETTKVPNSKNWGMFHPKRQEDIMRCPAIDEGEEFDPNEGLDCDFQSDAAFGGTMTDDTITKDQDVELPLGRKKEVSLRHMKSDSTDSNGSARYNPKADGDGLTSLHKESFKGRPLTINHSMNDQAAQEWDESVYQRNINELQTRSIAESAVAVRRGDMSSKSGYSASQGEQSDWDESFQLIPSAAGNKQLEEPVGTTPRRERQDIELSLSRVSEEEEVALTYKYHHFRNTATVPSHEVSAILDFDMGEENEMVSGTSQVSATKQGEKNQADDTKKMSSHLTTKSTNSSSRHNKKIEGSNDVNTRIGDMSVSGKSDCLQSEGTKTKIFGRFVLGQNRNPLLPKTVVEETYLRNIPIVPSPKASAILDNDLGNMGRVTSEVIAMEQTGKNPKATAEKKTAHVKAKSTKLTSNVNKSVERSENPNSEVGETSASGNSQCVQSEGSKTKIFGRIVEIMGQKNNPLIPKAVMEKTYVVPASMEQTMTMGQPDNENAPGRSKVPNQAQKKTRQTKTFEKEPNVTHQKKDSKKSRERKPPLNKENLSTYPRTSLTETVFDDSTTVIAMAVSNGNLKALQSNEEEDDTPPNYLALRLKKKAMEDSEHTQERTPIDANSFVAAIRGARHQECPGVALEGIASRNPNRDPTSDGNDNYEVRNLAPTPRRPERVKSLDGIGPVKDHDPPLDDTREHQRMITERLYAASSSSFDDGTRTGKLLESSSDPANDEAHNLLKMVPTVDSAASYDDENEDTGVEVEINNKEKAMTENRKEEKQDHRPTRKMRMSFLPRRLKLKI